MTRPLTLLLLLAWLAGPPAWAGEPRWAGVALDALPALAIGAPTLSLDGSGWRAPLDGGGFVQVDIFEDEASARAVFDFQRVSAFSAPQPALDIGGDVPAVGDGIGAALFLDRNVVVLISDRGDRAVERCAALRGALEIAPERAPVPWEERSLDGQIVRWDRYGRIIAEPPR